MDDVVAVEVAGLRRRQCVRTEGRGVDGGGRSVMLEFDLAKTAGYAAARRRPADQLPEDYEISFWMRGEAGRNHLEVKFVDASGDNVWWYPSGELHVFRRLAAGADQAAADRIRLGAGDGSSTLRHFESIEFVSAQASRAAREISGSTGLRSSR